MEGWSRFLDAFFKRELIERYLPAIMKGMAVTIEIAAAVVVTGIVLGLVLAIVRAFRVLAGERADRGLRRYVPGAAAARSGAARLFRPAERRDQFAVLRGAVARALAGARRLCRGDFLGRYLVGSEGPVGGGALDRLGLSRHARLCRAAAGNAARRFRRSPIAPSPSPRTPRSAR